MPTDAAALSWPQLMIYGGVLILGASLAMFLMGKSTKPENVAMPLVSRFQQFVLYGGVLLGVVFWNMFYLDNFQPHRFTGIAAIGMWLVTFLSGMMHASGVPSLILTLIPKDPISDHLEKQRRNTLSRDLLWIVTGIMSVVSFLALTTWVNTRIGINDGRYMYAIPLFITVFTVLIPYFSMEQLAPEDWQYRMRRQAAFEKERMLLEADRQKMMQDYMRFTGQVIVETAETLPMRQQGAELLANLLVEYNRYLALQDRGLAAALRMTHGLNAYMDQDDLEQRIQELRAQLTHDLPFDVDPKFLPASTGKTPTALDARETSNVRRR